MEMKIIFGSGWNSKLQYEDSKMVFTNLLARNPD